MMKNPADHNGAKHNEPVGALLLCLLVYVLTVAGYGFWRVTESETQVILCADRRLMIAARSLKHMLAPDFHDRATGPESIALDEIDRNRIAVSEFAEETDFTYVYTLVEKDGSYFFSAPTVTEEELAELRSWYWYPYEDVPDEFREAFESGETQFVTYTDQWGTFRSVAMPEYSPGGRKYLACADYDISYMHSLLVGEYVKATFTALSFLVAVLPMFLVYRWSYRKHHAALEAVNRRLVDYQYHLGELVEERTADLAVAKEAAEEANRLKSRFVCNVSHEIRTPMHGIIGFCEALLSTNSIDEARGHGQVILKEAESLQRLINDLLDIAKVESGRMELEIRAFSLPLALDEVSSGTRVLIGQKPLRYVLDVSPDVPEYLKGDSFRLRQILMNLLSNAVRFTDEGTVTLRVRLVDGSDEQPRVRFAVEDTGIGIPKERLGSIFESFVQGDASTTRRFGGTGLGTTIAAELVAAMQGTIDVVSEQGKGSTFWFEIPLERAEEAEVTNEATRGSDVGQLLMASTAARILVVDDYATNRQLAELLLKSAGHQVTLAETGEQALDACRETTFDLILMDLQMPGMDGTEAVQRIRAMDHPNARVPILAMTASGEASTRSACLEASMDDVMVKPIRREPFLITCSIWLQDVPSRVSPPAPTPP